MLWSEAHSHRLLRTCLLGSKRKLPPLACQARLGLPSVVCRLVYICYQGLCQALKPTVFLLHPVLTAFAEDAVAAHSSAMDSAWELACTLQEILVRTTDHDLCRSCIYLQPFLLHFFFPGQRSFYHRSLIIGNIGTKERVLVRQDKRVIRIRAIEVLLYFLKVSFIIINFCILFKETILQILR